MLSIIFRLQLYVYLCLSEFEGSFNLVDPRRQFLLKMPGHGFNGKLIQLLCPTTMAHFKIAECWSQKRNLELHFLSYSSGVC